MATTALADTEGITSTLHCKKGGRRRGFATTRKEVGVALHIGGEPTGVEQLSILEES